MKENGGHISRELTEHMNYHHRVSYIPWGADEKYLAEGSRHDKYSSLMSMRNFKNVNVAYPVEIQQKGKGVTEPQ